MYEGIQEIILREHVLRTYRKEVFVFLAERELKTLEDISTVAEHYEEAHTRTGPFERKDHTSYLELHDLV